MTRDREVVLRLDITLVGDFILRHEILSDQSITNTDWREQPWLLRYINAWCFVWCSACE